MRRHLYQVRCYKYPRIPAIFEYYVCAFNRFHAKHLGLAHLRDAYAINKKDVRKDYRVFIHRI
ncbi:hypothetical protein EOM81_01720 [bacterium]|nr:hypothetical protein [bacterium]